MYKKRKTSAFQIWRRHLAGKEIIMKTWKGYEKGINLGGWLSQCEHTTEHYDTFIVEADIAKISSWDIDHVRVPIDYNLLEDKDGNYQENGFAYIQKIIDWCEKYHLNMILDLHKTAGFSFDAGEQESGFFEEENYQERFYRLWENLSRRYRKYKDRLAFELLNEITEKEYMKAWLQISDTCIKRIRAICSDIDILVGGYWNNSVIAVPSLALPQDSHIIYNFHCYEPLIFTHQGAGWVEGMPANFRTGIHRNYQELLADTMQYLPNQTQCFDTVTDLTASFGADFFLNLFQEAVQVAEEREVRLYCGEFGVIDLASEEDTKFWYQCIRSAFAQYHIGHAAWNYKEKNYDMSDGALFQ